MPRCPTANHLQQGAFPVVEKERGRSLCSTERLRDSRLVFVNEEFRLRTGKINCILPWAVGAKGSQ